MQPFVVNRHGRIVFPSNLVPELDFSVIDSLEQLDSVIRSATSRRRRRPARTSCERVEEGSYASRYELMRDVALNMFWTGRFAPHDVREAADPVDVMSRVTAPTSSCPSSALGGRRPEGGGCPDGVRRAAVDLGRVRRGPDLRDPVRRLRPPQAPRDRAARDQAHRGGDHVRPGQPHLPAEELRPRLPDVTGSTRSSTAARTSPELEALHRWAMVLHNQYPWDRSQAELVEVGQLRTTTTSWSSTRVTRRSAGSCAGSDSADAPADRAGRQSRRGSRCGPTRRSTCASTSR